MRRFSCYSVFFFFNDTATTEIYTLSLHDALPILNLPILNKRLFAPVRKLLVDAQRGICFSQEAQLKLKDKIIELTRMQGDRKSTRLNSSHANISYAVFCLKKKKITITLKYEMN